MSGTSWTTSELFDRLTRAISETRQLLGDTPPLGDVLMQLEDVEARLRAREAVDDAYRGSLSFHVIAMRELEDGDDTHLPYLNRLSELASHLKRKPGA